MIKKPHVVVIDPGVMKAETACFNHMMELSQLPLSYHLPAMLGLDSLQHELDGIAGVIVMGSASSVNDNLAWQRPLEKWVRTHAEKQIPTFGICYGHQMIAHAFGGKVEFHQPDKKKQVGFREVRFQANPLCSQSVGKVFVTHNEHVTQLPEGFEVMGSSDIVTIDAMKHKELPVFSLQPHPEAIPKFAELRSPGQSVDPKDFHFGHDLLRRFLDLCAQTKKK